jgi:hypothetical protein
MEFLHIPWSTPDQERWQQTRKPNRSIDLHGFFLEEQMKKRKRKDKQVEVEVWVSARRNREEKKIRKSDGGERERERGRRRNKKEQVVWERSREEVKKSDGKGIKFATHLYQADICPFTHFLSSFLTMVIFNLFILNLKSQTLNPNP